MTKVRYIYLTCLQDIPKEEDAFVLGLAPHEKILEQFEKVWGPLFNCL